LKRLNFPRDLRASLAKRLLTIPEGEREAWLNRIIELILAQNLSDPHVSVEHVKIAIEECLEPNKLKDTETVFNVIDAYDVPRIKFDISRRKFIIDDESSRISEARYKSLIFKHRFEMMWHRTLRHKEFLSSRFEKRDTGKKSNPMIPIECLLSEQQSGKVRVMGLLTQLREDEYHLEDTSGTVRIDLTDTDFQDTFVMEGCIAIASGVYKDGTLHVEKIDFPPIESSESSRSDFGDANTFGGPSKLSLKMSEKLQVHEESNQDGMIVFIAELWLDVPNVLQKFKTVLEGYTDYPPVAFVLCGHFLSSPTNAASAQVLANGFKNLADIIARYASLKESSRFVFVPGPQDLGSPKIFPKPRLPKCIVEQMTKTLPNAIFTTNPCRIQYCTKEIVVLREDMLTKMCRNALRLPRKEHFKHVSVAAVHDRRRMSTIRRHAGRSVTIEWRKKFPVCQGHHQPIAFDPGASSSPAGILEIRSRSADISNAGSHCGRRQF